MFDSLHVRPRCSAAHLACFAVFALILGMSGCDEDGPPNPPRSGRTVNIPLDVGSLSEAIDQAVPGDTLVLAGVIIETLTASLVVESSVTPLVIRGDKTLALVIAPNNSVPSIIFKSPKAGTRVDFVGFAGGNPAIEITGSGSMAVDNCTFTSGVIGIFGGGNDLTVSASGNFIRDPTVFGFQTGLGTRLIAEQNTIVGAGDCGVLAGGSSRLTLIGNLIVESVNFGIACRGGVLTAETGCNDVFGSGNEDYSQCEPAETSFSLDPLFCDEDLGDFTLNFSSPCSDLNSGEECGRIGAFVVTCGEAP